MIELGTLLAAETLFEKTLSLLGRFYYWMYPQKGDAEAGKDLSKLIEEKEYVPVLVEKVEMVDEGVGTDTV